MSEDFDARFAAALNADLGGEPVDDDAAQEVADDESEAPEGQEVEAEEIEAGGGEDEDAADDDDEAGDVIELDELLTLDDEGDRKVEFVVDGKPVEKTIAEIVEIAQQNLAADKRLEGVKAEKAALEKERAALHAQREEASQQHATLVRRLSELAKPPEKPDFKAIRDEEGYEAAQDARDAYEAAQEAAKEHERALAKEIENAKSEAAKERAANWATTFPEYATAASFPMREFQEFARDALGMPTEQIAFLTTRQIRVIEDARQLPELRKQLEAMKDQQEATKAAHAKVRKKLVKKTPRPASPSLEPGAHKQRITASGRIRKTAEKARSTGRQSDVDDYFSAAFGG